MNRKIYDEVSLLLESQNNLIQKQNSTIDTLLRENARLKNFLNMTEIESKV